MQQTVNARLSGLVVATLLLGSPLFTHADALGDALDAALKSEIRTDAERARDRNRMPKQTLAFFGLEPDMKVLEVFPGGGWYTKLLVPVLADKGEYIAVGGLGKALGFGPILGRLTSQPGYDDLEIVDISEALSSTAIRGQMDMAKTNFGVSRVDLALTFRNLHNLSPEGRMEMYRALHKSLKRGGRLGVIDHTRRHMQPDSLEIWRRLDPVQVIKEATEAGFTFVDYANLHYRADDELRYEVGRKSVSGNTDRFTLMFKK